VKVGDLVRVKPCKLPGPRSLEKEPWMLKFGIVIKNDTFQCSTVQWSNGYVKKVNPSHMEVISENR